MKWQPPGHIVTGWDLLMMTVAATVVFGLLMKLLIALVS